MIKAVETYIAVQGLIKPGDKVIIAVSGGPDSMALLHILWRLSQRLRFTVIVAHINHQLRPQADAEQRFVEAYCRNWQLAFYAKTIDVRGLARRKKTSLEDAGRQARYNFFQELLLQLAADSIATAHHRDDQAETVLLHLLRGTGMQGLRGIMPRNRHLIRPLLLQSKQDILDYLQTEKIAYCVDQSNLDPSFLRNRVRLQLIPLLQNQYNPQISESLSRLAEIIRADNELLQQITAEHWTRLVLSADEHNVEMDVVAFQALPLAAQRRLALMALTKVGGAGGWESSDVEKVLGLLNKPGSAKTLQLKKGIKVNKSYDRIIFASMWPQADVFALAVTIPGEVTLPDGRRYSFSLTDSGDCCNQRPDETIIGLDYDKLSLPLLLRTRQAGDVIRPPGLAGHKKLKKYLNEKRIPLRARERLAILAGESGEIYALLGLCVCAPAVVDQHSQHILWIKRVTDENDGDNL